jgi:hypothetical protein
VRVIVILCRNELAQKEVNWLPLAFTGLIQHKLAQKASNHAARGINLSSSLSVLLKMSQARDSKKCILELLEGLPAFLPNVHGLALLPLLHVATPGCTGSSVRHGGRELHSAKIHEIPGAPGVEGGGYASTI